MCFTLLVEKSCGLEDCKRGVVHLPTAQDLEVQAHLVLPDCTRRYDAFATTSMSKLTLACISHHKWTFFADERILCLIQVFSRLGAAIAVPLYMVVQPCTTQ